MISLKASLSETTTSFSNRKSSCPEEYRELRRRSNDWQDEMDDDDDDDTNLDNSPWRENVCDQAMKLIARYRHNSRIDPKIILTYCPYYFESLALAQENNDTLCESKKQELMAKREQWEMAKKKRRDESDSSDDSDEKKKRRALRRRELKKRLALRFIHKRS